MRCQRTHVPELPPILATHALLQPTGNPVESSGPTSDAGHAGPRSTGHEATEQFDAEGITAIGRLYPSTSDTAQLHFSISTRGSNHAMIVPS